MAINGGVPPDLSFSDPVINPRTGRADVSQGSARAMITNNKFAMVMPDGTQRILKIRGEELTTHNLTPSQIIAILKVITNLALTNQGQPPHTPNAVLLEYPPITETDAFIKILTYIQSKDASEAARNELLAQIRTANGKAQQRQAQGAVADGANAPRADRDLGQAAARAAAGEVVAPPVMDNRTKINSILFKIDGNLRDLKNQNVNKTLKTLDIFENLQELSKCDLAGRTELKPMLKLVKAITLPSAWQEGFDKMFNEISNKIDNRQTVPGRQQARAAAPQAAPARQHVQPRAAAPRAAQPAQAVAALARPPAPTGAQKIAYDEESRKLDSFIKTSFSESIKQPALDLLKHLENQTPEVREMGTEILRHLTEYEDDLPDYFSELGKKSPSVQKFVADFIKANNPDLYESVFKTKLEARGATFDANGNFVSYIPRR